MSANYEPSVDELKRESERTRATLTHTVTELRQKAGDTAAELKARVAPAHIKQELKDYVREGRENLVQSLERKARDNPLQAVAVGAALAYPLWGMLRSIPAPILLLGAGLWFAGKGGKSSVNQAKAKAGEVFEKATAEVSDWAESAQAAGAQGATRVTETVTDAGTALASGVSSITDKAKAVAHDIRDSVAGMGNTVVDTVTNAATNAAGAASQTGSNIKDMAVEAGGQTRNVFVDIVDRNPLVVAGVGLAIGAFIAASLPPSDAENRILGGRSDDLKDKAREVASQGIERAKEVATDIVGDMASAAAREGLNADGLKKAVDGLTGSVKAVADRGVQTALGETSPVSQGSSQPYKS